MADELNRQEKDLQTKLNGGSTSFQKRLEDVKDQLMSYQSIIHGINESISQIKEEVKGIEDSAGDHHADTEVTALKPNPRVMRNTQTIIPLTDEMGRKTYSLEELILDFLRTNPHGIRISDMEGPFRETRMRIGFVVKKLLDTDQIKKINDLYFPAE